MFEKVNPAHPDKLADRIAGAIVDIAYKMEENPRIAVEVLLGHGYCSIIVESSVKLNIETVTKAVWRIAGPTSVNYTYAPQDAHLADNQSGAIRCGDNGIFKGMPISHEQRVLTRVAKDIYKRFPTDGKYLLDGYRLTICQSNADRKLLQAFPIVQKWGAIINPLGDWTGGLSVDAGATNRKLGSDMGDGVTGGGLHGKDLSKADVSVNIYAHLKAQETGRPVELSCSIGDETVDGRPYAEIVEIAREYIQSVGGFEKFAEWGLIR